jgi:hypothetical protein
MTVLKLNERPGSTEDGIKVFEDTDWNEQRVATTSQGIMKMFACYEEALKKKSSLPRQLQCLISSRHRLGLVYHHLYCWTLEMTIQITGLQFKR